MMAEMGERRRGAAAVLRLAVLWVCLNAAAVMAEDPYFYFTWNVTYGSIAPLGVAQQGILINGEFPGPNINSTSNNNLVVNVFNHLDEPFLLTWNGVQQRKNSWQEGLPGTNCPIPPGANHTYKFQVKDQIGSYFYYPSTALHRSAGGFGGLRINSRLLIPVPYADPEDDYTLLIGDWYSQSHAALRRTLEAGRTLARPDGVLINGQSGNDPAASPLFTMKPGKTYKYRVCNVGMKTTLNFRFQGHTMKLVEAEGSHTVQNVYDSLDAHVGQCYAVLITADREPRDYHLVASTRFLKQVLTATGVVRYDGGEGGADPALPEPPVGWAWSLNQFRSFRWNLTASAARPNPQGSYHYGSINITRTIRLRSSAEYDAGGNLRYAINGVSHVDPETPLKLAEYYGVAGRVFRYDNIPDEPPAAGAPLRLEPIVLNVTYRTFVEVVFANPEKSVQTWHLAGYSFFPVAIEAGAWSPEKRRDYNLQDAVSRNTIQVYPGSWAAVMLTFDNAGMWNLRSGIAERAYLGQQLYISVVSPERSLRDEYEAPADTPLCGVVRGLPRPPPYVA